MKRLVTLVLVFVFVVVQGVTTSRSWASMRDGLFTALEHIPPERPAEVTASVESAAGPTVVEVIHPSIGLLVAPHQAMIYSGQTVTFADPAAVDTSATFPTAGAYVLRSTADDGALAASEEVTITVNPVEVDCNSLIDGEMKAWQPVTISFCGPLANELDDSPNPFLDYRLQVTFTGPSGQTYNVPGFFDGDGNGASSGDIWKVKFTPDEAGTWDYLASFRYGTDVAISLDPSAGLPSPYIDGETGEFVISPRDPNAPGFWGKGRLVYDNIFYLKTLGDNQYWIKGGTDSPENFLGYDGFDNTPIGPEGIHYYDEHGGIFGALDYLSSKNVNSIYPLLMNIGGDGQDVFPYSVINDPSGSSSNDNYHFDISKLAQWEALFTYAQQRGINLNLVLSEGEAKNKQELDNAQLGVERKLYYREMVARFGHHNALQWMLCEEYDYVELALSPDLVKSWAEYISQIDAYHHPTSVHNMAEVAWQPFFGDDRFDLTSYQFNASGSDYSAKVEDLRDQSLGRPITISIDEPITTGTQDDESHREIDRGGWIQHVYGQIYIRKNVIYPIYFSGGMVELILQELLETDGFSDFGPVWDYMYYARRFLEENTPFWEMEPHDELLTDEAGHGDVLAKTGEVYAVYLPDSSQSGKLNLSVHYRTLSMKADS